MKLIQMRINSVECIGRVLVRFCLVVSVLICKPKNQQQHQQIS